MHWDLSVQFLPYIFKFQISLQIGNKVWKMARCDAFSRQSNPANCNKLHLTGNPHRTMVKTRRSQQEPARSQQESAQSNNKARYDSDDEPPEEAVLCWKMDPTKSLSDWTIEVGSKPGGKTKVDTYHCHKNILAVGPRHSEYFAHLLQSGDRFAEGQSNTSRIELEALAATAFPVLLDFMYNQHSSLAVNSKNAAALHYLGQYFGIRRLRWEARKFWTSDLSVSNAGKHTMSMLVCFRTKSS
jgi:hypothetical protein